MSHHRPERAAAFQVSALLHLNLNTRAHFKSSQCKCIKLSGHNFTLSVVPKYDFTRPPRLPRLHKLPATHNSSIGPPTGADPHKADHISTPLTEIHRPAYRRAPYRDCHAYLSSQPRTIVQLAHLLEQIPTKPQRGPFSSPETTLLRLYFRLSMGFRGRWVQKWNFYFLNINIFIDII